MIHNQTLGACYAGGGRCRFRVWAPLAERVEVHLLSPPERVVPLQRDAKGYYQALLEEIDPGTQYLYRLNGEKERSDPASRYQPQGIHGPSQVVDPHFAWTDRSWVGRPLRDYVLYEIHVGTYTPQGSFEAIIPHLDRLQELGITALELMPVAQFPGGRNWGYDGVYPFAVQNTYGGPEGLKNLVNACHQKGLAVVLDVVYNHLGPEGNYLWDFGPYFTDRYKTPWGACLNFDGPHNDEVRRFFIENALYWVTECHVDALRLDAVHAILDFSAKPFLEELAQVVHEEAERLGRPVLIIPESALNDTRLIHPAELGGFGHDAQWNDDFHHALHSLLTGERSGYYQDFGQFRHLVKAFGDGYVYDGQYSAFRRRRHGRSSRDIPAHRFVVFAQNHDQVGNRMRGERLSSLVSFEALKLAAGAVILSPFVPLLFMGEEYGETAPFPYFVSHSDPGLVEAVRKGRKAEFASFGWRKEPPDPQDEGTFLSARLDHDLRLEGNHQVLFDFNKELLRMRREISPFTRMDKRAMEITALEKDEVLFLRRWSEAEEAALVLHFGQRPRTVTLPLPGGEWTKELDSSDDRWGGPGSRVPDDITSDGEATLTLQPQTIGILTSRKDILN
ncbi:MAG: malto-oligosyltrehalose trehalohydrolase [Desulfobacterales bacterium]|nr:malto-oligosyltrehalose trehalohydrolase [Desulfobacterales bacterium]